MQLQQIIEGLLLLDFVEFSGNGNYLNNGTHKDDTVHIIFMSLYVIVILYIKKGIVCYS